MVAGINLEVANDTKPHCDRLFRSLTQCQSAYVYGHLAAVCTSKVTKITTTNLLGSFLVIDFDGKESSAVWKEHITDPDGVVIMRAGLPVDGPRQNRYPHVTDPRGPALEIAAYGILLYSLNCVSVYCVCMCVQQRANPCTHTYARAHKYTHIHTVACTPSARTYA